MIDETKTINIKASRYILFNSIYFVHIRRQKQTVLIERDSPAQN